MNVADGEKTKKKGRRCQRKSQKGEIFRGKKRNLKKKRKKMRIAKKMDRKNKDVFPAEIFLSLSLSLSWKWRKYTRKRTKNNI